MGRQNRRRDLPPGDRCASHVNELACRQLALCQATFFGVCIGWKSSVEFGGGLPGIEVDGKVRRFKEFLDGVQRWSRVERLDAERIASPFCEVRVAIVPESHRAIGRFSGPFTTIARPAQKGLAFRQPSSIVSSSDATRMMRG